MSKDTPANPASKLEQFTEPCADAPGLSTITDIKGFLGALKETLDPVFEEQRKVWEREGPAAEARVESLGFDIDSIGGNCPVQAYGTVDGKRFYFRARYDEWQFHVADTDDQIFDAPSFYIERPYGAAFEAGWMPKHEAIGFICDSVEEYRAILAHEESE